MCFQISWWPSILFILSLLQGVQSGKATELMFLVLSSTSLLVFARVEQRGFFDSSWYAVMFWFCAENSADNFCYFWAVLAQSQHFFCSSPHPTSPVRGLEVHKELGGETARTADSSRPKDIPHHVIPPEYIMYTMYIMYIMWGEEEGRWGGHLESCHLSSQVTLVWWRPVSLELAEHLTAHWKR